MTKENVDTNNNEAKNENQESGKKKKIAAVFHPQNMKKKPRRKPAGKPGEGRKDGDDKKSGAPKKRTDGKTDNRRTNSRDDKKGGVKSDNKKRFDGKKNDNRGKSDNRAKGGKAKGGASEKSGSDKPAASKEKTFQKSKDYKSNAKKKDYKKPKKKERFNKVKKPDQRKQAPKVEPKVEEKIKEITIPERITIKDLGKAMKVSPADIVKKLFLSGKIVTLNDEVEYEMAEEIAMEYDILCEKEIPVDVIEELLKEDEEDPSLLEKRAPIVCVMGHVDHGKTSLLDALRNSDVTAGEAGGITQHIGASVVDVKGRKITFLDTPGHEAFTAMRLRGAKSTDIAILVVAADDGVMPQTIEAINHAKAAEIEIVVAINKMDKPSANIDRVKQELSEHGLVPEDWGGETICVPVSAHTGDGISDLMDMLVLVSEMMELKANPNRAARGLVIEGELDKGKGPVATVLVQKGTLHVGDILACGAAHGKVRAMTDDKGRRVKVAGPSTPVEILGLNSVPNAGEVFVGCENEKEARSFAETFIAENKAKLVDQTKQKMSLDDLFSEIQAGNIKELNVVVKADVQGSVEAIRQSLMKLSNNEVAVKIIHGGVGAINESDVILASASNAVIIGFNVRPDAQAKDTADREGVDVRLYRVIYNIIEDVEDAMKGMLDPVFEEKVIGHAEIRQTFKASGIGTIGGAYVLDGLFERGVMTRVIRDGVVIFDGNLASLKRFQDDVKQVKAGYECGLVFEKFNNIKEGDQVEAYKMVEIPRK